jgi:hypothetical protein
MRTKGFATHPAEAVAAAVVELGGIGDAEIRHAANRGDEVGQGVSAMDWPGRQMLWGPGYTTPQFIGHRYNSF